MSRSNKSLTDLFRAAQHEADAAPELLSYSESERLLRNSAMRSVPVTHTIRQQLYERLLSTPLRLGITAMTTATAVTIGALALQSLLPRTATPPRQLAVTSAPEAHNLELVAPRQLSVPPISIDIPNPVKFYFSVQPLASSVVQDKPAPDPIVTPVAGATDSLKPIDLSTDQLARLGIALEDDGAISLYQKAKTGERIRGLKIRPNSSVSTSFLKASDVRGVNLTTAAPRMVTSSSGGNKFMMYGTDDQGLSNLFIKSVQRTDSSFSQRSLSIALSHDSSDNNISMHIGGDGESWNMNLNKDDGNAAINLEIANGNDSSQALKLHIDKDMLQMNDSDLFKQPLFRNLHSKDTLMTELRNALKQAFSKMKGVKNGATTIEVGSDNSMVSSSRHPARTSVRMSHTFSSSSDTAGHSGEPSNMIIISNDDSPTLKDLTDSAMSKFKHTNIQSFAVSSNQAVVMDDQMTAIADAGMFNLDSMMRASGMPDSVRHRAIFRDEQVFQSETSDSTHPGSVRKMIKVKLAYPGHPANIDLPAAHPMLKQMGHPEAQSFEQAYRNFTHDTVDWKNLIPIRVRNMNNPANSNELIFWYEPTPEVTNILPHLSAPYVTPKSKHLTLSVYPNPTTGPATIRYELKDAKQAEFSIHNLLGQKMLDGGTTSGVFGEQKIDLSSLDAGVYLLITTTEDGDRDIERIIVTK